MADYTGTATLAAGDTVFFRRNQVWSGGADKSEYFNLTGGVTYDGGSWGMGNRAKLQLSGNLASYISNNTTYRDNPVVRLLSDNDVFETVFSNFEIDCNGYDGSGIWINRPSKRDLVGATKWIRNVSIYNSSTVHNGGDGIRIGARDGFDVENVVVYHCQIYTMSSNGIVVYEQYGGGTAHIGHVAIRDNDIYNVGRGTGTGINGSPVWSQGVKIKNNVNDIRVEHNAIHGITDNDAGHAIMVQADSGTRAPDLVVIRYNLIFDNLHRGITILDINDPGNTSDVDIYGNILFNNGLNAIHLESTLGKTITVRIYNNTCFENGRAATGEIFVADSSAVFNPFELKDNILYALPSKYAFYSQTEGRLTSHAHNTYYHSSFSDVVQDGRNTYTTSLIADWETTALGSDPGFQDSSSPPSGFTGTYLADLRPNTEGFNLSSTSSAKDSGAFLSSPYSTSINSVNRPQGSGWDRGAYEYNEQQVIQGTRLFFILAPPFLGRE